MATAAQKANQARFAAIARAMRGGGATASGTKKAHPVRDALHRIRWGEAALAAIAGYYLPSTAERLGVGGILSSVPGYEKVLGKIQAVSSAPEWQGDGLVGFAKVGALGGLSKIGYDYVKTGRISDSKLSVAVPALLGVVMDDVTDSGGMSFSGSGGVSW